MRFISKNANLRIVLKHSIPAEPITGRLAVPPLYVRFENGVVNVSNEESVKMMLAHSGFERDFVAVEESQRDPYKETRKEIEPDHQITELKYGHPEKTVGSSHNVKLDPKLKDIAVEMAKEMAKEMAPQIAKDMLLEMAKQSKDRKVQEKNSGEVSNSEESEPTIELKKVDTSTITNVTGSGEEKVEFTCSCGKTAKTKAGLMAHQRGCKVFKNETEISE